MRRNCVQVVSSNFGAELLALPSGVEMSIGSPLVLRQGLVAGDSRVVGGFQGVLGEVDIICALLVARAIITAAPLETKYVQRHYSH